MKYYVSQACMKSAFKVKVPVTLNRRTVLMTLLQNDPFRMKLGKQVPGM